jgi:PAS domain S-box-containing protein
MTERSAYVLETLREDREFTLYRGRQRGNPSPVLAVALAAERPSPQSLRRLEHEYSLAAELDSKWATRPLALTRHEGRMMLVLEDPGGEPLDTVLARGRGQPLELTRFLRVATSLATALGQVHRHGMIHKDVKPANVLVDDAGNVRLTGFGIASRLPRESQPPAPPEVTAGTLAYMAPEQTGRMNRSIDSRSDLYSLGITCYEMLTGTLPFSAADPIEWIHCHIARRPVPPGERVTGVPPQLSAIVMKLLAKAAEERYQTAAGLEADLHRCLTEWEASRRIDSFPLSVHDVPDRLLIPETLYGREREIDALLTSFDRVVASGTPELVLVSGYSGVGKSSVVYELHKALVAPRGLFASGKFDQYKRDIPYATLAQAFQSLLRSLLAQSDAELGRWRDALREALRDNGQLIVNLVPELEIVLGPQPPVADLAPQDAKYRFQMLFRRFVAVFARPEHPLALFLDDLQWLDAATLDLLEHLVTHSEVQHLLLVGAYRDNEVGAAHPLIRTLEAIRTAGAQVHEIVLAPLGLDDVDRLISDALHCEPERSLPLAQLVHEKTGGNPFFAIQFFTTLADEGLLAFDAVAPGWQWDMNRIRASSYTDNVVELMAGKLGRLSASAQEALTQLACLGNVAEVDTLALIHRESAETMHAALWDAVRAGLVLRQESAYKFLHDRIQQAAYLLIPEAQRAAVHLRIGRVLLAGMTADELSEHLFDVANQLNRGAARLMDRDEKTQVAMIDLRAGRSAKASAAYASARAYFSAGMALFGEGDWGRQYELTFRLWLERAECEFLSGNFDKAEQLIAELLRRAASKVDQAAVYQLKLLLHTVKSENPQAVASAHTCLRLFGIELPAHPTWEQVQAEYETVWQTLEGRPTESLIDLPLMTDPELQAAVQLLSVLGPPAYFTDFHSFCLIACRTVKIGMQHGISDASALGFALLGFISGPVFHRYHEGYRFARLACDLVEKHRFIANQPKVYHAAGTVAFWTQPIETAIDFMRACTRTAIETGDLTFACYGMHQIVPGLLLRNDPLDAVWRESEMALDVAREARYGDAADIIRSQQRFIATMQGRTASFSTFSDAQFDETAFEAQLTGDRMPLMVCFYWILKLKARFLSGDYAEALAAADNAKSLLSIATAQIELLDYFYFAALTVAVLFEKGSPAEQTAWRELLTAHREQLREWADTYPPTFGDKHALVSAEIARLERRDSDAMRLYEQAIQSAREHGFVQNEALAHEVAARFYLARGFETIAHAYLRNARNCYDRWGALGKLKQLDARYPHLHDEQAATSPTATIGTPVGQLDVETVIKASQALSSEIVLPRLIEKLMRIAVEHAGAARGLLILFREDMPQIEAEATTGHGRVEVNVRRAAVTPSDLPQSALHYVIRTQERVVVDDASTSRSYSNDAYVREKRPRSVLCVPIVKQTKLVGALYLENNLTSCAFTADRIAVLELLASQAAISLENALLYADLHHENSERKRAEEALREREARIRRLVESNIIGVIFWDLAGAITEANDAFLQSVGYSRHDLLSGKVDWAAMTPPEYRAADAQAIEQIRQSGTCKPLAKEFMRKDGGRVAVLVGGATIEGSGGQGVTFVLDVTRHRTAEANLARSEKLLREQASLLDLTHDTVFVRDMSDTITYWNHGAEELYGWRREETVGQTSHQLLQTGFPEPPGEINAQLLRMGRWEGELVHRKRDGAQVVVASRWVLQRDECGNAVAILETNNDVTRQRLREREHEDMQLRLRQAEKMEAMGTLAGGIAHDFNNILGAILGYGELAQKDVAEGSEVRRYLDNVMNAGGRAKSLVERILAFSRSGVGERGLINVQAVIVEALELLATSLAPGVHLAKRLDTGDAAVIGDATQLHQIAMNLCTNAAQAMEHGGELEVSLHRAEVAQDRRLSHGNLARGAYVRLCVSDTGSGIPPHVLDRMFEPFFTTKGASEGTGLGLSLVHRIVADFGGAIDVRTTVGYGTTFTIWLPIAGEASAPSTEVTAELPHGDGQTVMIVDDEKSLVALAEEILAKLGYEPVGFNTSRAALDAFREAPQRFDIVLTDETMPALIGTALAREISLLRPDIPIVLMSGYTGAPLNERARAVGIREVLRKPLQSKDIAECLRRVLR